MPRVRRDKSRYDPFNIPEPASITQPHKQKSTQEVVLEWKKKIKSQAQAQGQGNTQTVAKKTKQSGETIPATGELSMLSVLSSQLQQPARFQLQSRQHLEKMKELNTSAAAVFDKIKNGANTFFQSYFALDTHPVYIKTAAVTLYEFGPKIQKLEQEKQKLIEALEQEKARSYNESMLNEAYVLVAEVKIWCWQSKKLIIKMRHKLYNYSTPRGTPLPAAPDVLPLSQTQFERAMVEVSFHLESFQQYKRQMLEDATTTSQQFIVTYAAPDGQQLVFPSPITPARVRQNKELTTELASTFGKVVLLYNSVVNNNKIAQKAQQEHQQKTLHVVRSNTEFNSAFEQINKNVESVNALLDQFDAQYVRFVAFTNSEYLKTQQVTLASVRLDRANLKMMQAQCNIIKLQLALTIRFYGGAYGTKLQDNLQEQQIKKKTAALIRQYATQVLNSIEVFEASARLRDRVAHPYEHLHPAAMGAGRVGAASEVPPQQGTGAAAEGGPEINETTKRDLKKLEKLKRVYAEKKENAKTQAEQLLEKIKNINKFSGEDLQFIRDQSSVLVVNAVTEHQWNTEESCRAFNEELSTIVKHNNEQLQKIDKEKQILQYILQHNIYTLEFITNSMTKLQKDMNNFHKNLLQQFVYGQAISELSNCLRNRQAQQKLQVAMSPQKIENILQQRSKTYQLQHEYEHHLSDIVQSKEGMQF